MKNLVGLVVKLWDLLRILGIAHWLQIPIFNYKVPDMKKIAFALLPFLLIACAPKKDAAAFIEGKHTIESPCPEGNCKLEVLKNKSLSVKTDGTGMLYYSLEDAPRKVVIRYTYDRIFPKDVEDGQYTETIIFETDAEFSNLKTGNIKDTKMLFGVQCFCRGKAGFYKVSEGTVSYADEKLHVKIPDSIIDDQRINMFDAVLRK